MTMYMAINLSNRVVDGIQPHQCKEVDQQTAVKYEKLLPHDIKIVGTAEAKKNKKAKKEVEEVKEEVEAVNPAATATEEIF